MRKIWAFLWYQNLQTLKEVEKIGLGFFKSLYPISLHLSTVIYMEQHNAHMLNS